MTSASLPGLISLGNLTVLIPATLTPQLLLFSVNGYTKIV